MTNRSPAVQRLGLCVLRLRLFSALAEASIRERKRALHQFNALLFAANQEGNHPEIHQGDFTQVQNFAHAGGRSLPSEGRRYGPTESAR